ncbi:MAG: hypothetical protein CMO63_06210 [Verrucomicrobiales bacterium]|nr:hypothetical protein [Verrucomicrobiales bacterium]
MILAQIHLTETLNKSKPQGGAKARPAFNQRTILCPLLRAKAGFTEQQACQALGQALIWPAGLFSVKCLRAAFW